MNVPLETEPDTLLVQLLDGLDALLERGAFEAALRCAKDVFALEHPTQTGVELRQRAIVLLAQQADLRADRQSGRVDEATLRQDLRELQTRARDYLGEVRRFATARRVSANHAVVALGQVRRALSDHAAANRQTAPPATIFVSYRRADSQTTTSVIVEEIRQRFGDEAVFFDILSIPLGAKYLPYLVSTLARCRACLVIIGPQWVDSRDAKGRRRLDDPDDIVRQEVEAALDTNIPVVPVLVQGAGMPDPATLPSTIRGLLERQNREIRPQDAMVDIRKLVDTLETQLF